MTEKKNDKHNLKSNCDSTLEDFADIKSKSEINISNALPALKTPKTFPDFDSKRAFERLNDKIQKLK